MYEKLLIVGHNEDRATAIFGPIARLVYDRMGDLPLMIATALTSNSYGKMRLIARIFKNFPIAPLIIG
jgi:NADH:ubiquinone oxidoreductase subunit 5 (subunit L)/multisubunit Na+/H+ antiporter MnhA subunit